MYIIFFLDEKKKKKKKTYLLYENENDCDFHILFVSSSFCYVVYLSLFRNKKIEGRKNEN